MTGDETGPTLEAGRPVHVDLQLLRVPLIDPSGTDDRALLAGALQAGLGIFDPDVRRPELQLVGGGILAHRLVRSSRARTCCTPGIGGCNGFGTLPLSSIRRPSGSTCIKFRRLGPRTLSGINASFRRPNRAIRSRKPTTCRAPPVSVRPAWIAARRRRMIASIGWTSLGHTSTQKLQRVQSHIPVGPWSASSRTVRAVLSSRGSATNRQAFASAAGPRKPLSTSCAVQAATQAPHMMQASTLWNWAEPAGRDNGPVGGRCSACTQGSIACTLPQKERMSTARSLSTGRWRSGSMLITLWRSHSLRTEVRQASFSAPLMVIAHDPQIADRQEYRNVR